MRIESDLYIRVKIVAAKLKVRPCKVIEMCLSKSLPEMEREVEGK